MNFPDFAVNGISKNPPSCFLDCYKNITSILQQQPVKINYLTINFFKSNALETWHAILVGFADDPHKARKPILPVGYLQNRSYAARTSCSLILSLIAVSSMMLQIALHFMLSQSENIRNPPCRATSHIFAGFKLMDFMQA
ncbi:MAG: hypothetical protein ACLTTO_08480 [Lachnospiraceae bacterium]